MIVLEYLKEVLLKSGLIILFFGLYLLLCGGTMHFFSNFIRRKLADIMGDKAYIYLTAPGVMVHELGHAVFCLIFRHKIVEMKLFSPENDGTLGYVSHTYNINSFYQRAGNFFIGTGPLWGGLLVLHFLSSLLLPEASSHYNIESQAANEQFAEVLFSGNFWLRWQTWVWLYFFLTITSHMTLSAPDLKGAWDGVIFLVLFIFLFELVFCRIDIINVYVLDKVFKLAFFILAQISGILMFSFLFVVILSLFSRRRGRT